MKFCIYITLIIYILIYDIKSGVSLSSGSLELMNDDDLLNHIRTENYVVVLFTKKDCERCEQYEDALYQIREDLVDSVNAWVVKVMNSNLVRIYSPSKEPALVFFRHGVPLLYEDEVNEELILQTFTDNREPCVKELTDENFEHLTQVSTGATTGDWFILFYSTDCIECQNLQARWESVCAKLKTRLNVARINKQTLGKVTGRRFSVTTVPAFLFFRHGKLYRYSPSKYDISLLSSFPVETYVKARVEIVSPPKAFMEDLYLWLWEFAHEYAFLLKLASTIIGVIVVVSFAMKVNAKKEKKKGTQKRTKTK